METAQRNQTDVVEKAQLVLLCVAPDADNWTWAAEQIDRLYETGKEFLVVLTKSDLARDDLDAEKYLQAKVTQKTGSQRKLISVSSHSGENLDRLKFEISATAIGTATGENAIVGSTLLRTRESLKLASSSVAGALEAAQEEFGQEIVAAEIRQSLDALGQIVGTVYNDDILDLVFGRFCIGK